MFSGTLIKAFGCILYIVLFDQSATESAKQLFARVDLFVFVFGALATSTLFLLLNFEKYRLALTAFGIIWVTGMVILITFGGGLGNPIVSCFLALMIILCFAVWLFGHILKRVIKGLSVENQRVVASKLSTGKLAESDVLTGLLNRNGAESNYQELLRKLDSTEECIIIYFVNLDNFKNINNLFDHFAGDELLKTMSYRLSELMEHEGFVCRFGGDEFVIVVRAEQTFDDEDFAKKILHSLAQPYSILGTEAEVTASIGIKRVTDVLSSFNSVSKKADIAMNKAKLLGKNNYYPYSNELHREYMRKLNIVSSLKHAVSNDLLALHFQPKINLDTHRVDGAEALLRWVNSNPDGIGPEEFIPVIESTELIHIIGNWVITEACKKCKAWHDSGQMLTVAVNVSAYQLIRSGFYENVVAALEASQLAPEFLEIEITEHSLLQEMTLVNTQLEWLKKLGVSLAIDDFGTGYSNMGYLARLQVDVLKLDRSFVSNITSSEEFLVIVNAVIKMAKVLGMKVVAEGIETEEERKILNDLGCDYGQGYLWSPAVTDHKLLTTVDGLQQGPLQSSIDFGMG